MCCPTPKEWIYRHILIYRGVCFGRGISDGLKGMALVFYCTFKALGAGCYARPLTAMHPAMPAEAPARKRLAGADLTTSDSHSSACRWWGATRWCECASGCFHTCHASEWTHDNAHIKAAYVECGRGGTHPPTYVFSQKVFTRLGHSRIALQHRISSQVQIPPLTISNIAKFTALYGILCRTVAMLPFQRLRRPSERTTWRTASIRGNCPARGSLPPPGLPGLLLLLDILLLAVPMRRRAASEAGCPPPAATRGDGAHKASGDKACT